MLIRNETAHSILGVPGRLNNLHVPPAPWVSGVFANQTWVSEARPSKGYARGATMTVNIRFDDNCKNGHMSFAITADVREPMRGSVARGCMHDEIAKVFPELAPLIRWHLMATDGPMHYVANTVFHASDRDHSGRAAGEPCAFEYGYRFNDSPITSRVGAKFFAWVESRRADGGEFRVIAIGNEKRAGETYEFSPHYTFAGFGERWHDCPFSDKAAADEMALALNTCRVEPLKVATEFSKGKARDFAAARSCAIWPDATDEQLSLPKAELTALLEARLPALIAEFRTDMESIGFLWEAPAR